MVKLPRNPPDQLDIDNDDLADWPHSLMVRIHGTVGPYALPWYQLRHYGPTRTRFDPHPPPPAVHPDYAVLYAAADLDTALAEVFQRGRFVQANAPNYPYVTIWQPTRPLRLLDIRGQWPIRHGASHGINTGPHPTCRRWAHAIATHPQRVDGLLHTSSMTGHDASALFLPSANAFPEHPALSLPLSDPGLTGVINRASRRIGYDLA